MSYSYADAFGGPYGQSIPGFAVGTQPPEPSSTNGFTRFLSDLIPVVENAADAFRQAKGLPTRYSQAREQAMAGYNLGQWLENRSAARQARLDRTPTLVEDTDDVFKQALAKIFADPDVLKNPSALFASPAIDPSALGVRMIPTPVPQFRPTTPRQQR